MGREVRKVPANWSHPKNERGHPQPMFDETFAKAAEDWKRSLAEHKPDAHEGYEYWEWDGDPPDRKYYRPWSDDEAVWFQVWETVSEGTPVTPPFETREELIGYLVEHGDFWDQERGCGGWERENAEAFVGRGWAPSMMVINSPGKKTIIKAPRDTGDEL